jgi:hypothetical protein
MHGGKDNMDDRYKFCKFCDEIFYKGDTPDFIWARKLHCSKECQENYKNGCYRKKPRKELTRLDFLDNWDVDRNDLRKVREKLGKKRLEQYFVFVKQKVLNGDVSDFRTGFGFLLGSFM